MGPMGPSCCMSNLAAVMSALLVVEQLLHCWLVTTCGMLWLWLSFHRRAATTPYTGPVPIVTHVHGKQCFTAARLVSWLHGSQTTGANSSYSTVTAVEDTSAGPVLFKPLIPHAPKSASASASTSLSAAWSFGFAEPCVAASHVCSAGNDFAYDHSDGWSEAWYMPNAWNIPPSIARVRGVNSLKHWLACRPVDFGCDWHQDVCVNFASKVALEPC